MLVASTNNLIAQTVPYVQVGKGFLADQGSRGKLVECRK